MKVGRSIEVRQKLAKCLAGTILYFELGSLSNDDGDGTENGKKAIGLGQQNNNFARESRFFVHFVAVTARQRRESA